MEIEIVHFLYESLRKSSKYSHQMYRLIRFWSSLKALLSAGWVFTYRFTGEPGKWFDISLDNVKVNAWVTNVCFSVMGNEKVLSLLLGLYLGSWSVSSLRWLLVNPKFSGNGRIVVSWKCRREKAHKGPWF
jgi:hypothetical protein